MARQLVNCMERAGYSVDIASNLRAFLRDPDSETDNASLKAQAASEIERLSALWIQHGEPLL